MHTKSLWCLHMLTAEKQSGDQETEKKVIKMFVYLFLCGRFKGVPCSLTAQSHFDWFFFGTQICHPTSLPVTLSIFISCIQ